jgi:hypothetical protein
MNRSNQSSSLRPWVLIEWVDYNRSSRIKYQQGYSCNARTVHKLQGRSLDNTFLSTLDYIQITGFIPRFKTLNGLFLRSKKKLLSSKVRGINIIVSTHDMITCYTTPHDVFCVNEDWQQYSLNHVELFCSDDIGEKEGER